jgi:hypothetical protein
MVQTEDVLASQGKRHGLAYGFRFQSCVRYATIRRRGNTVQTLDIRMDDKPPSQINSSFKLHVPGLTHAPHEVASTPLSMCSLLHTLELHVLPLPRHRIKTYLSHHLGIIINYYS